MTSGAICPVCGRQLAARDRPQGGRRPRYCSGACKTKAYRARQQEGGPPPDTPPTPPAARHARVVEIRQKVSELAGTMADTASGQQALFPSAADRRRVHPAEAARTLHRLIAELTALAVTATVTERVTKRQVPGGTTPTMPLFDESGNE